MKRLFFTLLCFYTLALPTRAVAATSLSLSSSTTAPKVGQAFTITLNLTSSESTLGTDIVMVYDPNVLDFTSITPGTLYPNYSKTQDSPPPGKVFISAVADFTKGVTPTGIFATITFTPKTAGATQVSLDYQPQATNLTQVIPFESENSTNLLTQAPNPLALTIITKSSFPLFLIPLILVVIVGIVIFIRFTSKRSADPELVEEPPAPPTTPPAAPLS